MFISLRSDNICKGESRMLIIGLWADISGFQFKWIKLAN